jgi:hypothetical protein
MSTTATWTSWAGDCTAGSATSSSCYTTTGVWNGWVTTTYEGTSATTTTYDTGTVWLTWVDGKCVLVKDYVYEPKVESAEEKVARLERERAYAEQCRIEAEKRTREAEERERKAYAFLLLCLDEKQKKDLEEKKHFELSVVGGRRYRIKTGQSRNIQELDQDGKVKRTLCFHPQNGLHHYDAMAIQKLTLECDEERALKVANFS